jgi:septal ring factor EnvC (AmiA/AmiB activator)
MNSLEELDLDQELRLELEKLDQIFLVDTYDKSHSSPQKGSSLGLDGDCTPFNRSRLSQSAFELAEAEIEKEELHDKLQFLLSKTEDYDRQLLDVTNLNFELKSRNEQFQRENERLLQRIAELETLNSSKSVHPFEKQSSSLRSDGEFRELEFKLAETRSKLARTQQAYDDLSLAKDSALIELEKERMIRVHVEKERDAYSAAYEQSLLHFERWSTKTKLTSKFALSR